MKKNGLFTGWKDVYAFTAAQNMKGGGYKASTIILGLVIAVIFALISILMAVFQGTDEDHTTVDVEDGSLEDISVVYLIESDVLADEELANLITVALSLDGAVEEKLTVTRLQEVDTVIGWDDSSDAIYVEAEYSEEDNETIMLNAYVGESSKLNDGTVDEYMDYVMTYIDVYGYQIAGVAAEDMPYFMAPYFSQASSVDDEAQNISVMMTEMLAPMIFSLIIYAMVLMHGQSVTKAVVAEKSSKLMEMILTSVKPYALIAGKVLAVATMAIVQLIVWIACGVGGYMLGGAVAERINPDYINYVDVIIDMLNMENGEGAFSVWAAILAILFLVVGFIMYCVLAGLVSASVSKMEDISTAMSMFQIPVVIGWMAAYLVPLFEADGLLHIVYLLPITSPFILPADVIIGRCDMVEAIASFAILVVTTVALILLTGKIYKGKLFNRK